MSLFSHQSTFIYHDVARIENRCVIEATHVMPRRDYILLILANLISNEEIKELEFRLAIQKQSRFSIPKLLNSPYIYEYTRDNDIQSENMKEAV